MYQSLFSLTENIYLLNHSVGRMPVDMLEAVQEHFFSPWQQATPDAWSEWITVFDGFTNALSQLLGSQPECFCPQSNISSGLSKWIGSLPPAGRKNRIVMTENDFPSVGFAMQQVKALGYNITFIPKNSDPLDISVWNNTLSPDVFAALITHVHYNTSKRVPVERIVSLCSQRDIVSIVDIAQSAGVVPINLDDWNADIVLGSCVKWLCGGPGAGFMWLNPERTQQWQPKDVGWFSHQNPFEFDIHHFEYANNANRFWGGTPSVLPYVVATHSINTIMHIGVNVVHQHNQALTQQVIDALPIEFMVSPSNTDNRGGTLVINPPNKTAVIARLDKANVNYDVRPLGMRFSPHIYNTPEQMNLLIECILGK